MPTMLTAAEMAELKRRRHGRNIATLCVLFGLSILFFGITIAKFKH